MILAKELARVLDNLPETVQLLSCKFEFGDRPCVVVQIGDNAEKIKGRIQRQAIISKRLYKPENIVRVVCERFSIAKEDIKDKCRKRNLVRARQMLCWTLRQHTSFSYNDIAQYVYGTFDHTTAFHHVRRVDELLYIEDAHTTEHVAHIENALSTSHPTPPTP